MQHEPNARATRQPGLISLFLPTLTGGGAERVMLNLAIGLADSGHAVEFVLAKAMGQYLPLVPASVAVVDLQGEVAGSARIVLPRLAKYLRTRRPAVLLSAIDSANIVALVANKIAGSPTRVVVSLHNTMSVHLNSTPGPREILYRLLIKTLYRRADGIIAVSQGVADDFARFASVQASAIRVIYNPVVSDQLLAKAREAVSDPWLNDAAVPVILSVGRLTEQKNYQLLVRAFAEVHKKTACRLIVLGEGEKRDELERLIAELGVQGSVRLPGFVDNPFAYMARARVFALSSRWEGLPTVLIEALACGARVISTDCPSGPREILAEGRFGTLVPVDDVRAFAAAIEGAIRGGTRPASVPSPDAESWSPYRTERVVGEYAGALAQIAS